MITYEESDSPRFAVAEAGLAITEALQWVRENDEPLMVPDSDGYYMLVHTGPSGDPVIEPPGVILNIKDIRLAASKFRAFLLVRG
jgi:hypothetical protein